MIDLFRYKNFMSSFRRQALNYLYEWPDCGLKFELVDVKLQGFTERFMILFSFLSSTLICILHLQINFQTTKFGKKIQQSWFGAKWDFEKAFFVNKAKAKLNIELKYFVIWNCINKNGRKEMN